MKRAKLKYLIQQYDKGNHTMIYNLLHCKDSWVYIKYFKLEKTEKLINKLKEKE